jgi:hypothetical protein
VGGFEAVLLTAGVAALVFAVVVGVLLRRPLPALAQQAPNCPSPIKLQTIE